MQTERELMSTAQKTRKIIIAAVVVNITAFTAIQVFAVTEPCKPNALGMCMIRKKGAEKATWTVNIFSLRERLVLKAKETSKLLKAPLLAVKFMEHCGLKEEWNSFFSDYRQILTARQQAVPYKRIVFACSEES